MPIHIVNLYQVKVPLEINFPYYAFIWKTISPISDLVEMHLNALAACIGIMFHKLQQPFLSDLPIFVVKSFIYREK